MLWSRNWYGIRIVQGGADGIKDGIKYDIKRLRRRTGARLECAIQRNILSAHLMTSRMVFECETLDDAGGW